MQKENRRKIEQAFYDYKKNREIAVCKALNDIAVRVTANYDKLAVQGGIRRGFDDILIRAVDAETFAYKWCKVVEKTLDKFRGEYKDRLIEKIYFERKGISRTAYELHIGRATLFRWRDEIFLTAEFWAQEYGLIRVFPPKVSKDETF